ncbi:MAG: bifunctional oligoribonuclease/PAP phosphatase NrnA [Flavobacteriales bacterium]|nr:bifunctional oligoribonuclease/PAP phosphatase NrnA [Flavobacteriales bacterium]MCB9364998.1 bifunctional oligoribonuclease/PAP phosphatase NrnA [Flavobacteriales bacterium]
MNIEEIKKEINQANYIVITTHKSPDGDAIGSSLGLYHYLKNRGKRAIVIVPDAFPDFLKWMSLSDDIVYFDKDQEIAENHVNQSDLIFSLDYNALSRIGELGKVIEESKANKMVIDHHQNPQEFANHYYVDTDCCSTAQLIYEFINELGDINSLTKDIAECLYCGIMTDTGSFRYPSTTAKTHQIIAHFLELGANGAKIHEHVYDTYSEHRLRLIGYALTQKMKVFPEYNAAYISLSQEELKQFNFQKGDTEGLVNYPLSINGIKFAALITEKEHDISLSLRSKDNFYVNEFANKHFQGGGHIYASGGKSDLSLVDTITKFEELLKEYKSKLV